MKKVLLCLCAFVLCTSVGVSQTQTWIGLGPSLSVKPGVNMSEIMSGRKTGLTIVAPDFGATLMLSLKNIKLGILLDLGYNTCKVLDKPESGASDNNTLITSVNYFTINPSFTYSNIVIGLNYGIPLSGSLDTKSGTNVLKYDNGDSFTSLSELRFGGMIPLIEDPTGRLYINIMGNYPLSSMFKNYTPTASNPSVGSISVGVSYLFTVANQ